jgi:predicted helicase
MTFHDILEKYRKVSFSERDKGSRFERLMQRYLKTDPIYESKFKQVWMWNDFLGRKDLGGKDTGIDLVALTHEGDYWAIQCKFFAQDAHIDKKSLDSFLSTSGRTFLNEDLQTVRFSNRLWISTTNSWGVNANEVVKNQSIPFNRLNLFDLESSPVDWEKLENGLTGIEARTAKKTIRPHQKKALDLANDHFKITDRGKLIMACGTGKTFTSLRIAENETKGKGLILFMVPSIALLGQTLREWSADANEPINAICICSDSGITKKQIQNDDTVDFSVVDLALPASTDVKSIIRQFRLYKENPAGGMTVVFSTYQSIDVIGEAQKRLLAEDPDAIFDMVICDEAHRTTGVTLAEGDESAFVKIHYNQFIKARKRMYMTATPRLYSDDSKSKAAQVDAVLCSMDDESLYGTEIYRIGFGEAVDRGLLTDYKVLILTLSENDVNPAVQKSIAFNANEINASDTLKLIGCINALSKHIIGDEGTIKTVDPLPMRRAVAFCQSIKVSKVITSSFNATSEVYLEGLEQEKRKGMVKANSTHIDGGMNAPERDRLLSWLKDPKMPEDECRILTNVRCLSEGVDVPSLDAVMFLSARNSQVDVVQSVGRVMRKSPGKNYGYIIIPVVIPADVDPVKALDDNERFKVVWTVLNALRAHDDRFNALVNKIELNKKKTGTVVIGSPSHGSDEGETSTPSGQQSQLGVQIRMEFEQLQSAVFAKLVQKVGDKRYWEQWAKSVAEIAERQIERLNRLIDEEHGDEFDKFLNGLQKNINPSISKQEAVEMLSQHIITRPVFDALFEGYSFVKNNPISLAMQNMLNILESHMVEKDFETLEKFYESVKKRAEGIDNAEGKQRIIIELYDKFFKTGFPKMVEKLGIVYTPVEVVDFIIHSVNDILKKEFDRTISDENIHILDPFTGTGTFIVSLLQSGLIDVKDLERKYKHELHANEIVLLAYYIAAINIENAYHDATPNPNDGVGKANYTPFDGIVLTDTFQLGESDDAEKLFSEMFPQNSARVQRQQKAPLRVIIGNPPYSVGQKSANDNAQNQKYTKLDARVESTYARASKATSVKALYDSYIKAYRWSTDRLDKTGGVICFVSNGAWLDVNGMDGFRLSLEKEFSSIYIFNLRGNQRTSGELSRREGGKIFGSGSRTPISITLLVKNPDIKTDKATIHYHDIGDYLDREQKLKIVKQFKTFGNPQFPLSTLQPNEHGDWISVRNDSFSTFFPIAAEKKFDQKTLTYFLTYSLGLATGRDAWVYNSSKEKLQENVIQSLNFYNSQSKQFKEKIELNPKIKVDDFIDADPKKVSWNRNLKEDLQRLKIHTFNKSSLYVGNYRPFFKQNLYFDKDYNAMLYQNKKLFPTPYSENIVIAVSGLGHQKEFSPFIANKIMDLQVVDKGQCFPLYYYEENNATQKGLFDTDESQQYVRRDAISDFILERAIKQYGNRVTKEDIFYYVYGFLHCPEYRITFANDLKKMLPRLPLVESPNDFWKFSKAGRQLAELHINYESVPPYEGLTVTGAELLSFLDSESSETKKYRVEKMRFPKKGQKDTIIYNSRITIEGIPDKAYEYVVNGKSAIEWIMERYQITTHKESGIKNDPNDWATEVGNPRYILDLLLSIINVSLKTVDIVNDLPKVNFETNA